MPAAHAADIPGPATSGASTLPAAGTSGSEATTTIAVPVVVQVRVDLNFANGCWVRMFDGINYKGSDGLIIAGPGV